MCLFDALFPRLRFIDVYVEYDVGWRQKRWYGGAIWWWSKRYAWFLGLNWRGRVISTLVHLEPIFWRMGWTTHHVEGFEPMIGNWSDLYLYQPMERCDGFPTRIFSLWCVGPPDSMHRAMLHPAHSLPSTNQTIPSPPSLTTTSSSSPHPLSKDSFP